jgi:LSD1 subclass zinc finger protein
MVETTIMGHEGAPPTESAEHLGVSEAAFYAAGYDWQDRFEENPKLRSVFDVRVHLGFAERQAGGAPALPEPKEAAIVWKRACPRCGAYKRTDPRTAYVYCDYCAQLFDYDWELAKDALFGLDPAAMFNTLVDGVRQEIRDAFKKKDWDRYREAWRWAYERDMALMPQTWSPRVRDVSYREAMSEWSAATCVVRNTDEPLRAAFGALGAATEQLGDRRDERALLEYFAVAEQVNDVITRTYAAAGLFESHPDGLDEAAFRRVQTATDLRELLQTADGPARQALLEASDLGREAVQVPAVSTTRSTCGGCGAALLVVDDATRLLCESCGLLLDAEARRFPCVSCGAPVVLTPGKSEIDCGYCQAHFHVA